MPLEMGNIKTKAAAGQQKRLLHALAGGIITIIRGNYFEKIWAFQELLMVIMTTMMTIKSVKSVVMNHDERVIRRGLFVITIRLLVQTFIKIGYFCWQKLLPLLHFLLIVRVIVTMIMSYRVLSIRLSIHTHTILHVNIFSICKRVHNP